jgi:branched-chain amino acid transport system ATP-binding protein
MGVTLSIHDLDSFYGSAHILHGISLELGLGEAIALIGRNGAGKSTTLRSILGLVTERRGRISHNGVDISRLATFEIARRGIGYVPEDRRIFTDLTVEENLLVGRRPRRGDGLEWTPARLYDLFPNLLQMRRRSSDRMSGGEQQMLSIARTLMGNPSVLLLDEPSEGLAPRIVEGMAKAILALKREGLSIMLSEQNLRFARLIADRAYVIESGTIRYSGTMAALAADQAVQAEYLAL